ncbi:L-type lectin-domain containing receptor kinase IV.2 [Acorus gramineus]|uniref:non-specific serine/threonine protein kinase n=1 Tax=Acorus gramineus TaxID=55184 RepID=A0AAV9BFC6_ACOGR|nr:L-type lectin-domain containing receptor kinase IV.2 [Acorus gramineus]
MPNIVVLNTLLCLLLLFETKASTSDNESFTFNGFRGANMSLNGLAEITSNGLLRLTNTSTEQKGHAFYPIPLHFNKSFSFSTTFVFAIVPRDPLESGHGIAFILSPNTILPGSISNQYLGLFNQSSNGNSTNHVVAVELDTILNNEFGDIDDNHVGIDVNGLRSVKAHTAGYFSDGTNRGFRNLSLTRWEQLVIHRDVKSSNVLLDGEMNARLGDFGLARLYDHGTDPQTTHVVGTLGYLAPELSKTGKGTTATDVYSFGAFLLEVACGRRPIDIQEEETMNMVDWVLDHWFKGTVMETVDERLGGKYAMEELELVLKLGLLCTHVVPSARPNMRQVMQFLDHDVELPDLSPDYMNVNKPRLEGYQGFNDFFMSYATSSDQAVLHTSTDEMSLLSG